MQSRRTKFRVGTLPYWSDDLPKRKPILALEGRGEKCFAPLNEYKLRRDLLLILATVLLLSAACIVVWKFVLQPPRPTPPRVGEITSVHFQGIRNGPKYEIDSEDRAECFAALRDDLNSDSCRFVDWKEEHGWGTQLIIQEGSTNRVFAMMGGDYTLFEPRLKIAWKSDRSRAWIKKYLDRGRAASLQFLRPEP